MNAASGRTRFRPRLAGLAGRRTLFPRERRREFAAYWILRAYVQRVASRTEGKFAETFVTGARAGSSRQELYRSGARFPDVPISGR
jgi:hypothetical protein